MYKRDDIYIFAAGRTLPEPTYDMYCNQEEILKFVHPFHFESAFPSSPHN